MKKKLVMLLSGLFLFFFGISIFSLEMMSFTYQNQAPENQKKTTVDTTEYVLSEDSFYEFVSQNCYIELKENNEIQDKIIVHASYQEEFGTLQSYSSDAESFGRSGKRMMYSFVKRDYFNVVASLSSFLIEDLKERTFHNYSQMVYPTIVVEVNKEQMKLISVSGRDIDLDDVLIESEFYA